MEAETTYGLISLIPVTVVIITAIITKRALEPLILGAVVGYFIVEGNPLGAVVGYKDALIGTISTPGYAYFIVLFGLFGAYMMFLEKTGAIKGFAQWGLKYSKNKKITGVFTWLIGMVLFLDNYFSILGAGASMKGIADKNRVSREMFTFNINVTGTAMCVMVPISAWGIFMTSQIEGLGLFSETAATSFIKTIPFMFYPMIALVFVLLYNVRAIPLFGPMKAAELRAETTGKLLPMGLEDDVEEDSTENVAPLYNFLVPMTILIGVTIYTKELLYGLIIGIVVCSILYIAQKRMKIGDIFNYIILGFQDMVLVTAIVISAFTLQAANDALGMAPFVIEGVKPIMSSIPALLPVIVFIVLALLSFVTGSFWGMAAIAFPIIVPLALDIGGNPYLSMGALIAGTCLGSCACFYCDSVTLACGTTGIRNDDYLKTAVPLVIPIALTALVAYVIAGFVIG